MEKTLPLISIIVPVYNVKENVVQCLESIAAQTFTHYECIVVDDGATDGSGDICDDYAATHERFLIGRRVN
ncbi:MAG: glycosyltransferase [Muribaculaceae bacterium]|nr:glycosyltransferase [Muribaculaceae bacterium]